MCQRSGRYAGAKIIMLMNMWLIQVPLAYLLPKYTSLDVWGVRWAMEPERATAAIIYIIYFRIGAWKRKKI